MADSRVISCEAAGFDCENYSMSTGKQESSGRKKLVLGGSVALAFGASLVLGYFVLGPVFQNAMVDHGHSQALGKFAFSNAGPVSRPLRPFATSGVEPVMFGGSRKAAPKKAVKKIAKAAPRKAVKKVAKKAAPKTVAKRAAPKPVARKSDEPPNGLKKLFSLSSVGGAQGVELGPEYKL